MYLPYTTRRRGGVSDKVIREKARSDAGHIFARARINADCVAFVHEHRDLQGIAGLDGCGLGGVGSSVADDCGLANGDEKFDEVRGLDGEGRALEEFHRDCHILFDEIEGVLNLTVIERYLLIGLGVHKVIELAVVVEIFHILGLDVGEVEFFGGVECLSENYSADGVLHLGAAEIRALAGLDLLEVADGNNVVLLKERAAFS